MATDFFSVYNAIFSAVEGRSFLLKGIPDGPLVPVNVPLRSAIQDPELRVAAGYPSLTLHCFDPVVAPYPVQDRLRRVVTVDAAAPYLEGVKVPTVALADGQTLEVTRYSKGSNADGDLAQVLTATFHTGQFTNISAAKPGEIAAALDGQLPGVSVTLRPGNTVRLRHSIASSNAGLKVTGGTAAALISTFPTYRVQGRDAGNEIQLLDPPIFYHFPVQVACKSKRFDHHTLMMALIDRLFVVPGSANQRWIPIADEIYEALRGGPTADPWAIEGVFTTSTMFTLQYVPVATSLGELQATETGDTFAGGNYDGTGVPAIESAPQGLTFELDIGPSQDPIV